MAVAPSATSAQTISRIDPASLISRLLMRVGATLLYEKQAYAKTIHPLARSSPRIVTTRTQPNVSSIRTLTDLKGRKLAVAGGPIDKNWLLLRASMKQDGIDLKSESTIVYGAPSLLAAKALGGEMDATVNYWNFCAALEAKGFRRLAGIEDLLPKLGA